MNEIKVQKKYSFRFVILTCFVSSLFTFVMTGSYIFHAGVKTYLDAVLSKEVFYLYSSYYERLRDVDISVNSGRIDEAKYKVAKLSIENYEVIKEIASSSVHGLISYDQKKKEDEFLAKNRESYNSYKTFVSNTK